MRAFLFPLGLTVAFMAVPAAYACPRGDASCIIGNLNNLNQQLYQQRQHFDHKVCHIACNSQYENDNEGLQQCLSQCDDNDN